MSDIQHNGQTLWSVRLGRNLRLGDIVETFRGERGTVTGGTSPHKQGSTGRVYVEMENGGWASEFFPSVIDAKWVKA